MTPSVREGKKKQEEREDQRKNRRKETRRGRDRELTSNTLEASRGG